MNLPSPAFLSNSSRSEGNGIEINICVPKYVNEEAGFELYRSPEEYLGIGIIQT